MRLVSLGGISHAFAYHFGDLIPQAPWPSEALPLPDEFEYFCFNRLNGWSFDVPFAWELVAEISLDRVQREVPERTVVVGRRVAGERLADIEP